MFSIMRGHFFLAHRALVAGSLAVLLIGFAGCRTTPRVDWDSRIGSYTYDQAVVDLGPPDKASTLSDGTTVAEWITGRSSGGGLTIGTGLFGSHGGVSVGHTVGTGSRDHILRLVFAPDKKLVSWTRN
jgi:hypothetical protein